MLHWNGFAHSCLIVHTNGGDLSHTYLLQYGVPQGSVLGQQLYVLYTAEVCHVVERHSMHLHLYADDSQIYTSVAVSDITSAVHRLAACIADVNNWMSASRLRFNRSKTEIMWLGAGQLLKQVDISDIPGVILDSQLSLSAHIAVLCRAGVYQLPQIQPAIRSLTPDAAVTIVQAFIACRLDWCNSLLYGVPENLCSQYRTLPLVYSPAHSDVTTSHHYCTSYTGCQFRDE